MTASGNNVGIMDRSGSLSKGVSVLQESDDAEAFKVSAIMLCIVLGPGQVSPGLHHQVHVWFDEPTCCQSVSSGKSDPSPSRQPRASKRQPPSLKRRCLRRSLADIEGYQSKV